MVVFLLFLLILRDSRNYKDYFKVIRNWVIKVFYQTLSVGLYIILNISFFRVLRVFKGIGG